MQKQLSFEKKITLGNILTIISMVAAIFIAYANIMIDIGMIKNDLAWIKQSMAPRIKTDLAKK